MEYNNKRSLVRSYKNIIRKVTYYWYRAKVCKKNSNKIAEEKW
jgi:hypothetical protein